MLIQFSIHPSFPGTAETIYRFRRFVLPSSYINRAVSCSKSDATEIRPAGLPDAAFQMGAAKPALHGHRKIAIDVAVGRAGRNFRREIFRKFGFDAAIGGGKAHGFAGRHFHE